MSSADIYDVLNPACPTQQVIGQVGQKWSALVLYALADRGTLRFGELRQAIRGVTQKMLTQTLRQLERDGFVTRTAYPTVPVTVEYGLTPLGRELAEVVGGIRAFAYARMPQIEAARADFDATRG
jgi:DNA-binding HxlR family transcriptional regulator